MNRPAWFDTVRAGDVLETPGGDLRLVRQVNRFGENGHRLYLTFAIRRCSWTRRPYTVKYYADADLRRYRWVGRYHGKLTTLNFLVQREIESPTHERVLRCCDARGVP